MNILKWYNRFREKRLKSLSTKSLVKKCKKGVTVDGEFSEEIYLIAHKAVIESKKLSKADVVSYFSFKKSYLSDFSLQLTCVERAYSYILHDLKLKEYNVVQKEHLKPGDKDVVLTFVKEADFKSLFRK